MNIIVFVFIVSPFMFVRAAKTTVKCEQAETGAITYCPLEANAFPGVDTTGKSLPDFLKTAFQFGLSLAAVLAVIMIIWGGVKTMLSESVFGKDEGKKIIQDALLGLGLALVSWLILFTINPELVNFKIN